MALSVICKVTNELSPEQETTSWIFRAALLQGLPSASSLEPTNMLLYSNNHKSLAQVQTLNQELEAFLPTQAKGASFTLYLLFEV